MKKYLIFILLIVIGVINLYPQYYGFKMPDITFKDNDGISQGAILFNELIKEPEEFIRRMYLFSCSNIGLHHIYSSFNKY